MLKVSQSDRKKRCESIGKSHTELSVELEKTNKKVSAIETSNIIIQDEQLEMKEKILDLEYRQRRNNLVFEGIPEGNPVTETSYDCYQKIVSVTRGIPQMSNNVSVERCHRLGAPPKRSSKFSRPIICCFTSFHDVRHILTNRKKLPTGIYVNEDLPEDWQDQRWILRPIFTAAQTNNDLKGKVKWSKDKLILNGKVKSAGPHNNIAEVADTIDLAGTCEKRQDDKILFQGIHSVFSIFHPAPFSMNGIKYANSEQYFQSQKGAVMDDDITHRKIMLTNNPFKIKRLSRRIRNYEDSKWQSVMTKVMYDAVKAKFEQNPALGALLISTGTLKIIEASPDHTWGCGLALKHPQVMSEPAWHGTGKMCDILSRVREELRSSPAQQSNA